MSQIEVPDWVVEIAAKAYFEDMCSLDRWNDPMDEKEREDWRDGARKIITAALGAWVVPVGIAEVKKLSERTSSYDIAPRDWSFYLSDGNHTLYTLRQEKPDVLP